MTLKHATPDLANRKNMMLLTQLRWLAVAGQILTIGFVRFYFGLDLPLALMGAVLLALATLNLGIFIWLRGHPDISEHSLFVALLGDVAALTAQCYLSGGASNPFVFLYLLQITLGVVLLGRRAAWGIVFITCLCFAGLTVWYRPFHLPHPAPDALFSLHILGMLICFALDAVLLAAFVTRVTRNLRARDTHFATLRQHAAEESLIVRMGLLASGAAHELGTPLALLSVIINDWQRMPPFSADAELLQEMNDMQKAVQRCKSIVTGILMAAGDARGDMPVVTSVNRFFDGITAEWRGLRAESNLLYQNDFGEDVAIVSDTALKQIVFNLLDNAFEASPGWIGFQVTREEDRLCLKVSDAGPGFSPEALAHFGNPYQSSKDKPGGGLGLFLVVNVIRKLGGFVTPANREKGGAMVTVHLPLAVLRLGALKHGK
jgi:two-component system sensor histidine kinase RegB